MTHAFFKALMFLGSGSVIHSMHEEQDIRKMGGLRKYMPITHATFLMGWFAIIGTPLFSGFFSKDEILWMSFHSPLGHKALWVMGAIAATLTAFYMTRLMSLTFWGKSRIDKSIHPHESPALMTVPLIVLAILSVIGGWIGVPHVIGHQIGVPNFLEHWFGPVIKEIPKLGASVASQEWILMGISVGLALVSATIAYHFYVRAPEKPKQVVERIKGIHNFIYNKYYVDEFYFSAVIDPLVKTSKNIWFYIDVNFIDKTTHVVSDLVRSGGLLIRTFQNGNIQQYTMYVTVGIVIALTIILMR